MSDMEVCSRDIRGRRINGEQLASIIRLVVVELFPLPDLPAFALDPFVVVILFGSNPVRFSSSRTHSGIFVHFYSVFSWRSNARDASVPGQRSARAARLDFIEHVIRSFRF